MIIDAHAHACGVFLKSKDIIEMLDMNNVDKVVLVPGEFGSDKNYSLPELATKFPNTDVISFTNFITKIVIRISGAAKQIDEGNRYVFSLAKDYPDRIVQFYWVKLSESDVLEKLKIHFSEYKFKGIKLHQCWESFSIDSYFFRQVAVWAENHDLPLFIHLYTDKDVIQLINYKRKHPNLKLIVAHLFGLELFIAEKFKDENLYFDTSTIQLISDIRFKKVIDFIGADKVLFGTDTPYGAKDNIKRNINRIKSLEISSRDKDLILGLNMKRLLKL